MSKKSVKEPLKKGQRNVGGWHIKKNVVCVKKKVGSVEGLGLVRGKVGARVGGCVGLGAAPARGTGQGWDGTARRSGEVGRAGCWGAGGWRVGCGFAGSRGRWFIHLNPNPTPQP